MKKINWTEIGRTVRTSFDKHTPEILMGFGIAGMLTTTVLAVKATPKAIKLLDKKKKEKKVDKLSAVDTVKTTWKCYIPATTTAGVSIACLVGSSKVSNKRNAALATAYKITENAYKEYREKVIETIGEKKEAAVRDKIAQDKIDNNPVENCQVYITDKGNTLCYDALSGRYFKSDIDLIKKVENKLNRRMIYDMYVSVNDLYSEIGLEPTDQGNDLGWNLDNGLLEITYTPRLNKKEEPCIVLDYNIAPKYNYFKIG